MNNSQLFKQAHAMTKQVIQAGDNYATTFGLCLKTIKDDIKQSTINDVNFVILITATLFMIIIVDNVKFVFTIVKVLSLVLAAPLSIAAAIAIDYNLSF